MIIILNKWNEVEMKATRIIAVPLSFLKEINKRKNKVKNLN